jgi:hypothetical protein
VVTGICETSYRDDPLAVIPRTSMTIEDKRRMENLLAGLQLELFPVEESAEEMFERLFPA